MSSFPFTLPKTAAFAGLFAIAVSATARADFGAEGTCGEYGTSVIFAESPAEAAKQALKEEKLVFVLHVSGHFEESDYT